MKIRIDDVTAVPQYGANVETVIVNEEIVVEKGRSIRTDDTELFAQAEAGVWNNWAGRVWNGKIVEQINPQAFPMRQL